MRIVCITYASSRDIHSAGDWLKRTAMYMGSWEILAGRHEIFRIDQVAFQGHLDWKGIHYEFEDTGRRRILIPWKLHRRVRGLAPDIVLVAGLHFPVQLILLRLQLPRGTRIIAQHHAEKPFRGIKKYLQRLALAGTDACFFASKLIAEKWVHHGSLPSLRKVHEVMEVSSPFKPSPDESGNPGLSGGTVFLFVGRLIPLKDPLIVVRAFMKFLLRRPDARLFMIYQSDYLLQEIRALAGSLENESIFFLGSLPHEQMEQWYRKAGFIISGSVYEGSGTAVCEAMSCGCIPVLPGIEAFRAMTNEGQCGLLYDAGNEEALLEALCLAVGSDICCEKKKVLERFHQSLSFEAIARKIQGIMASLQSKN